MSDEKWWTNDVPKVMEETEVFYTRVAELYPDKAKLPFTKKKIIEVREWESTRQMYDKHFEQVLKQLGFFYIPNRVIPGPTFVFPIRDVDGKYTCAQTKPSEGSVLSCPGMKYRYIGPKPAGPRWLGNDHATIKRIIDTQKVMVVEGPFDILAAKLLYPAAPILSPLTKSLGKQHIAYLRMLGVKNLMLMYDNEEARGTKEDGAGNMSMEQQVTLINHTKTMRATALICPKSDPSDCLKNPYYAEQLRNIIRAEFQY